MLVVPFSLACAAFSASPTYEPKASDDESEEYVNRFSEFQFEVDDKAPSQWAEIIDVVDLSLRGLSAYM